MPCRAKAAGNRKTAAEPGERGGERLRVREAITCLSVGVNHRGLGNLAQVLAGIDRALGSFPDLADGRNDDGEFQDADDGDDGQQFDERESAHDFTAVRAEADGMA